MKPAFSFLDKLRRVATVLLVIASPIWQARAQSSDKLRVNVKAEYGGAITGIQPGNAIEFDYDRVYEITLQAPPSLTAQVSCQTCNATVVVETTQTVVVTGPDGQPQATHTSLPVKVEEKGVVFSQLAPPGVPSGSGSGGDANGTGTQTTTSHKYKIRFLRREETDDSEGTTTTENGTSTNPVSARPGAIGNCCGGTLGSAPYMSDGPTTITMPGQSFFDYNIPLGARVNNDGNKLSFGMLRIHHLMSPDAQVSFSSISYKPTLESPLGKWLPSNSPSRSFFATGMFWFELVQSQSEGLTITQYPWNAFELAYDADGHPLEITGNGSGALKRYTFKNVGGSKVEIRHYVGASTLATSVEKFSAISDVVGSVLTWETEKGTETTIWKETTLLQSNPTSGVSKRLTVETEEMTKVGNNTYLPTNYHRDEHEIKSFQGYSTRRLARQVDGLGSNKIRTEYDYAYSRSKEIYLVDVTRAYNETSGTIISQVKADLSESVNQPHITKQPWLDSAGTDDNSVGLTKEVWPRAFIGEGNERGEETIVSLKTPDPLQEGEEEPSYSPKILSKFEDRIQNYSPPLSVNSYALSRHVLSKSAIGRTATRKSVEDRLLKSTPFDAFLEHKFAGEDENGTSFEVQKDYSGKIEGGTFRHAEASGNVTEFWPETPTLTDTGAAATLPSSGEPYKETIVVRDLLAGGTSPNSLRTLLGMGGLPAGDTPLLSAETNRIEGKTTRVITVTGKHGTARETTQVYTGGGWVNLSERTYLYTVQGELSTVMQDGVAVENHEHPPAGQDLPEVTTDVEGVITTQYRSADGDIVTTTREGVPASATLGAEAQPSIVTSFSKEWEVVGTAPAIVEKTLHVTTTSAGGLTLTEKTKEEVGGQTVATIDATGLETTYASSALTDTTTLPGGTRTQIQTRYLDGRLKSTGGSASVPVSYTYELLSNGLLERAITTIAGAGGGTRITTKTVTGDGEVLSESVNGLSTTFGYDSAGRVTSKTISGDTKLKVYRLAYDYRDLVIREGYDMDGDGALTAGSSDVFVERSRKYEQDGEGWWLVSTEIQYVDAGDAAKKLTTTRREKQGTGAGAVMEVIYPDGIKERTVRVVDRAAKTTEETTTLTRGEAPARSRKSVSYNGRLVAATSYELIQPVLYRYDALGRPTATIDPRTNTASSTTTYHAEKGQVIAVKNGANEEVEYGYYEATHANAGQQQWVKDAAGAYTHYAYNTRGQVTHQWGGGAQPLRYAYNGFGELTDLYTYHTADMSAWSGASLPAAFGSTAAGTFSQRKWTRGAGARISNRTFGDGTSVGYTYFSDGRVKTRSLRRSTLIGQSNVGLASTYNYDGAGRLTGITYTDGTPNVAATYDRAGRMASRSDAAGTHIFEHSLTGTMREKETVTGGLWDGLKLERRVNDQGRFAGSDWGFGAVPDHKTVFTYENDAPSRLQMASLDNLVSAFYGYAAHSKIVNAITRPITGSTRPLLGSITHDAAGRVDTLFWKRGTYVYGSHDYLLNSAGRREEDARADGTQMVYGYDARGELTSAVRKRADGSTRPDWSHGYGYDAAGHLTTRVTPEGETLSGTFSTNTPNFTETPRNKKWLHGRANPEAVVTVYGDPVTREGTAEDWRYLMTYPSGPQTEVRGYAVTAARPDLNPAPEPQVTVGLTTFPQITGHLHDADGNVREDGRWTYQWDGENRLKSMEQKHLIGTGDITVLKLEFAYDAFGRRISKKVFSNQRNYDQSLVNPNWTFVKETRFVWQDWTLLAEYVQTAAMPSLQLRRSYLWGLDVAGQAGGEMNGAGGVGGLLWVVDYLPGQATSNRQLAPWYDGNGNIMGWVENEALKEAPLHRLDYDPFGQLLVEDNVRTALTQKQENLGATAEWMDRPAFAFSTKYEDIESGLLYYGYRYYAPEKGRWMSRDPIAERGGINLYGMVGNDPVNEVDRLGLDPVVVAGGTSVNDPGRHDLSAWNFLNTAVRRAKELEAGIKKKGKKGSKEKVVLIVYSPPYERRAIAENKAPDHYLKIVRNAVSGAQIKLIEIRQKDDLTKELVNMLPASITSLDYFGHSNKNYLFLEYSSTPQTNGTHDASGNLRLKPENPSTNDFWGGLDTQNHDANKVPKTQFSVGATVASYGCNQGEKGGFADAVNKIWGVTSKGSDGRTDYSKAGAGGGPPFPSSANGYIIYP